MSILYFEHFKEKNKIDSDLAPGGLFTSSQIDCYSSQRLCDQISTLNLNR